ncbi:MAG: phosphate ABC transporter substrate-binding protein [Anaerolineales bacterium]|nr:phosphate ABC transporter substrate-binding protein [Anaerolineales bacterium]
MNKYGILVISLLVILLGGCIYLPGNISGAVVEETLIGELTFAGSTTVQPLAAELGDVFTKRYPDVKLSIAAGGSKVGIQAIHEGTVDIGMASRTLSVEESEGIIIHTIALDVIAIIVHPDNPVDDLDMETLAAIYTGEIDNWEPIGGPDLGIVPISRELSSGTRGAFDDLVLGGEEPSTSDLITAITAGDMAAAVAVNPAAIGYVGFGNISSDVKVLSISQVNPSPATVRNREYSLMRPLNLLTGPFSQPLADRFIEFVLTDEGQKIVTEAGWIPAKE